MSWIRATAGLTWRTPCELETTQVFPCRIPRSDDRSSQLSPDRSDWQVQELWKHSPWLQTFWHLFTSKSGISFAHRATSKRPCLQITRVRGSVSPTFPTLKNETSFWPLSRWGALLAWSSLFAVFVGINASRASNDNEVEWVSRKRKNARDENVQATRTLLATTSKKEKSGRTAHWVIPLKCTTCCIDEGRPLQPIKIPSWHPAMINHKPSMVCRGVEQVGFPNWFDPWAEFVLSDPMLDVVPKVASANASNRTTRFASWRWTRNETASFNFFSHSSRCAGVST